MDKKSFSTKLGNMKAKWENRKKDKKQWKEERKIKMLSEKNIRDHHKRIQSKNTLKAMRENKRKSDKLRAYR